MSVTSKEAELLERATNYFSDPTHRPVTTALLACWLSQTGTFAMECLIAGAALEGLAEYVLSTQLPAVDGKSESTEFELLKKTAREVLSNDSRTKDSKFLPRAFRRISSASLRHRPTDPEFFEFKKTVEEVLKQNDRTKAHPSLGALIGCIRTGKHEIAQAAASLGLSFTEEEFAAWENIRHARAHGDFSVNARNSDQLQVEMNSLATVANLMNKFVLVLIGYSGPYRDYSTTGYPVKELQAAKSAA